MKMFFVTTLLALVFAESLFAQCTTNVPGGTISGRWTRAGSPYCINGDVVVASLTIEAGVVVIFRGPYKFDVAGILTAVGTQVDSIRFRKDTSSAVRSWKGIAFISTNLANELAYCIVEGSDSSGIRNYNSTPRIRNSTIRRNTTTTFGGGLYTNSPLTLTNCVVQANRSDAGGGGIYSAARLTLNECVITSDSAVTTSRSTQTGGGILSASGGLKMRLCLVSGNVTRSQVNTGSAAYGGGIYLASDTLDTQNCIFERDSALAFASNPSPETSRGGGIYVQSGVAILTNTIVAFNGLRDRGTRTGGGINVASGNVSFLNSTIAYNEYDGLNRTGGTVTAKNSIFFFNGLNIDPLNGVQIVGGATVTYSDVHSRSDSLYPGQGNINANPIFRSVGSLCIIPPSPCIDSGDTSPIYNDVCISPNGPSYRTSLNDMGAHGGPGACNWPPCITSVGYSDKISSVSTDFRLEQNYPNPFNPETKINFQIPTVSDVELKIFDLLGREVATLVNERMNPGTYEATWNATGFASGVYLYRMRAGEFWGAKRLLLVR